MAKKLKADGASDVKGVSAEDLKKCVAEVSRQKGLASEYAGNAGKATANAVERFGLEKTAFTFARRLSDIEEGKRASIVRSSLEYWLKLGFFDQYSVFDDLAHTLRDILNIVERNDRPATEGSAVLDELTN